VTKRLIRKEREAGKTYKRKPGGGRKPKDFRVVLSAIFYVLRTGIQWKALPREYGSSSAIHRYFQFWSEAGVFLRMWQRGLGRYDEMAGIKWEWQSIDGSMVKAPLGREEAGPNPTDRGKKGSKRHILVDGAGGKEARRWVVERIFSWLNRFRKLLVRYEKKAVTYCGLLMLAWPLFVLDKLMLFKDKL
jgi:transposase